MDLEITITAKLSDSLWGFSDLLNGRELNDETKEEVRELIEENIYDAIYSDGNFTIKIAELLTNQPPQP